VAEPLPFAFDDDPCKLSGEGITRTTEPGAKFWPVEIRWPGRRPMRCTIRATNKQQAHQFAERRHPDASSITMIPRRLNPWP
jgi:hypothetical protein